MAATTASALGIVVSGYQIADNAIKANKAQDAIDNFKPQELTNPNKAIQLNTLKSEQQTKANNINLATSVDALQRGGPRTVLAGIPRLTEANILLQDKISQDLAEQEQRRDLLIARGEERIQSLQERREREALLGLGQQLNATNQNIVTGAGDLISSGLALSQSLNANKTPRPKVESVSTLNQVGVQDLNPTNPLDNQGSSFFNKNTGIIEFNASNINPLTGLPDFDQQGMMFQLNDRR